MADGGSEFLESRYLGGDGRSGPLRLSPYKSAKRERKPWLRWRTSLHRRMKTAFSQRVIQLRARSLWARDHGASSVLVGPHRSGASHSPSDFPSAWASPRRCYSLKPSSGKNLHIG